MTERRTASQPAQQVSQHAKHKRRYDARPIHHHVVCKPGYSLRLRSRSANTALSSIAGGLAIVCGQTLLCSRTYGSGSARVAYLRLRACPVLFAACRRCADRCPSCRLGETAHFHSLALLAALRSSVESGKNREFCRGKMSHWHRQGRSSGQEQLTLGETWAPRGATRWRVLRFAGFSHLARNFPSPGSPCPFVRRLATTVA